MNSIAVGFSCLFKPAVRLRKPALNCITPNHFIGGGLVFSPLPGLSGLLIRVSYPVCTFTHVSSARAWVLIKFDSTPPRVYISSQLKSSNFEPSYLFQKSSSSLSILAIIENLELDPRHVVSQAAGQDGGGSGHDAWYVLKSLSLCLCEYQNDIATPWMLSQMKSTTSLHVLTAVL